MPTRRLRSLVAATLVLTTAVRHPSLSAQGVFDSVPTSAGFCHLWAMPPGFSDYPRDASYQRCALDRPPVLRGPPAVPAPTRGLSAGGSFLVVVNPDGSVHPGLTRAYTSGVDSDFHRRALESIRRWRFDPGTRNGRAVRSAFEIQLTSDLRNDTLPSRLEWRYVTGEDSDTLVGTWRAEPPLPPLAQEQADSVYAAVLRRLVRMQVLLPANGRSYCVVPIGADSAAGAHLAGLASHAVPALNSAGAQAPDVCARTPGTLRIALTRVYRTEAGRAVLYPSGDYLPSWPAGYDGRPWRAWRGRCVAELSGRRDGSVASFCDIGPVYSADEMAAWAEQRLHPRQWSPVGHAAGDSVRVTVFVTTGGAWLTDTLRAVVARPARLDWGAVRDPSPPCGAWAAYSLQAAAGLYLIKGDLSSTSLNITRINTGRPPAAPPGIFRCEPPGPAGDFAAFLLGDIGDRATEPITLCFSQCARAYVLDPARHVLADRAHVTFRFADLRPDTRMGNYLKFRVVADPAPAGLTPLVIVSSHGRPPHSAWIPRRTGASAWDYEVNDGGGYPPDTEVRVYLLRR